MFGSLFGKKGYTNISPREGKERLSAGQNIILLDVRSPEEYREIHIPKSISLPLDQLKSGITKIASDKNTEIIVYCLSGMRAASACNQLAGMGYTNVSNMGGIQSWRYETEKGR
jgi:rhodanese-related sulfurtransferase